MNTLGIYFGLEGIQIVNIKKTELLSYTQIPRSAFEISEELGEEKVPQELKIVALIKEELRKAKIEAERLTLVLPGRELILRHFELPPIPQKELPSAISFEVVKYIPFKMNDLIWDYRAEFDKTNKRYLVLFSGIRKDSLDRYLSILNQLNMKILRIEYAGFSILRFLKKEKGISGIIDFDQGDELNFIILKNGFPVFSRDVSFMDKFSNTKDYLDKIKSELRISLDFYHRRFPTSAVHKLFLLAPYEYTEEISNFLKERKISVQILSLKFLKGLKEYSPSLLKACAGGLRSVVDLPEFLTAREKSLKPQKRPQVVEERINIVQELFSGLKLSKMSVFISLLLIGLSFIASLPKMKSLQLEIQKLKETHPQLTSVTPEMNYEEILEIERNSRLKLERIKSSLKEKRSLARIFKIIAQNKPYGVWLNQISFSPSIFSIKGMVYLEDSNREIESVNEFVTSLKKDAYFSKYFSEIELVSLERNEYLGKAVMTFIINCRAKKIE